MPTFTPLHHDLTFLSPLSEERAARLVAFLAEEQPSHVLDVGCGWGELLLRVLEAAPRARGLGVDLDEESLSAAREDAVRRGLGDRAVFEVRDARDVTGPCDAVTCIGASQIWGPDVAEAQPLDYAAALAALRALLPRGGRLVYGEGIWSRPPTPEAIAPLAGRDDEYVALGTLVRVAEAHGFAVVAAHEATLDEWDAFESGFTAGYARWLAAHEPDHPDAAGVRERVARQHAAYFARLPRRPRPGLPASWSRCERRRRADRRRRPRPRASPAELAAIDNAALDGHRPRHHTARDVPARVPRLRHGEGPCAGLWLARRPRPPGRLGRAAR